MAKRSYREQSSEFKENSGKGNLFWWFNSTRYWSRCIPYQQYREKKFEWYAGNNAFSSNLWKRGTSTTQCLNNSTTGGDANSRSVKVKNQPKEMWFFQRAFSMSEKRCLRNVAEDYCLLVNSKRTLYVQVPMTMSEKKLSKSQFVILNARFSTLNVHLLLQTCVYFVNSPNFNFNKKNNYEISTHKSLLSGKTWSGYCNADMGKPPSVNIDIG